MKTVDQVSRGVADFFDTEIRPSLSGFKAIAYGVAVGRVASRLPALLEQYAAILAPMGVVQDGKVDVEGLATELRKQMEKSGGEMKVTILGDTFTFKPHDVDNLIRHIERA